MRKILLVAKGNYPLQQYLNRLFPKFTRHPEQTYSLEQILLNYNSIMESAAERTCIMCGNIF